MLDIIVTCQQNRQATKRNDFELNSTNYTGQQDLKSKNLFLNEAVDIAHS